MPQVVYAHELPYFVPGGGGHAFPGMLVSVSRPGFPEVAVDVEVHIDTGSEYSVLGGWIVTAVDLTLLEGQPIDLAATAGPAIPARLHDVRVIHDGVGIFDLKVAFTLGDIRRNLLGRDFLNLVQIGFRERHLAFYVTPVP